MAWGWANFYFYVNYSFKINEGTVALLNNKLCVIMSQIQWAN